MGKTSDDAVPAVRSWRGRRGLVLAVVLPALAIASFSTVHLVSALGSAGAAARAGALARLTADSTGLAAALEAERNETVRFVALGAPPYGVIGRGSARTSIPATSLSRRSCTGPSPRPTGQPARSRPRPGPSAAPTRPWSGNRPPARWRRWGTLPNSAGAPPRRTFPPSASSASTAR